ncbi:MAG: hypothetical protein KDA24_05415 [Deltaproteobacteria bacterium]|nr:hypothetical protein [Deltaproteobacteria bacterium]
MSGPQNPEAGEELATVLSNLGDGAPTPEVPAFDALAQQLDAERGPMAWLRSRSTRERMGILVAAAAAVAVIAGTMGGWADVEKVTQTGFLLELVLLSGFALVAMSASLRGLQHAEIPRWAGWALVGATLGVPVAIGIAPMLSGVVSTGEATLRDALGCLCYGLSISAPVLAVAWVLDRRSWRGSTTVRYAASAAGLAGLVGLQLHCPVHETEHLMSGHVPVVFAMLGTAGLLHMVLRRP